VKTLPGPVFAIVLLFSASIACGQDQQMGARSKALGGVGTALEADPHSIWINPSGIAAQPDGLAVSLQTYTFYEETGNPIHKAQGRANGNDPIFLPPFIGAVLQVGSPELPQAVGFCLAAPYHVYFPFNGPNPTTPPTDAVVVDQTLMRLRFSYAIDFRLRPLGETGFFNRLALGLGADLAMTRFEYTSPPDNENSPVEYDADLSGGAGVLFGLYDNGEALRVTLGLSYQAPARHDFGDNLKAPLGVVPAFDFPQQVQVGLAFHLLDRLPLRLYLEVVWTDWKRAVEKSRLPGLDGFESSLNVSIGAEYRIELDPLVGLLPRVGIRYFDAPWKQSNRPDLPASGSHQLFIDSRSSSFVIFSFGVGLSWGYKEGTQDSLDLGFEVGGDAPSIALSYAFQF
jgi:hypothetical protein